MNKLNQVLLSCCLASASAIGIRALILTARIEDDLRETREMVTATAAQLRLTLQDTQAVLSSIRATTEALRRSSASQLGYYEAIGRRTSQLLAESTLLIRHTDQRLGRLADSAHGLLRETQTEIARAGNTFDVSAVATNQALVSISTAAKQAESSIASAEIPRIAENLVIASDHLARTSATAEEAMGHINAVMAPTTKGFWRRLFEAFIPRQTGVPMRTSVSK